MSQSQIDELAKLAHDRLRLDEKDIKQSLVKAVDTKQSGTATTATDTKQSSSAGSSATATPFPLIFVKFIDNYPPDFTTYYGFTSKALSRSWNDVLQTGNHFTGRSVQMMASIMTVAAITGKTCVTIGVGGMKRMSLDWDANKGELYAWPGFSNEIKQCTQNLMVISVIMRVVLEGETQSRGHSNLIIINHISKTIERFEPYGYSMIVYVINGLDKELYKLFEKELPGYEYHGAFFRNCPTGPQRLQSAEPDAKKLPIKNLPGGWCAAWSVWFTHMQLLHPQVKAHDLMTTMMKSLEDAKKNKTLTSLTAFIASYIHIVMRGGIILLVDACSQRLWDGIYRAKGKGDRLVADVVDECATTVFANLARG